MAKSKTKTKFLSLKLKNKRKKIRRLPKKTKKLCVLKSPTLGTASVQITYTSVSMIPKKTVSQLLRNS